MAKKAKTEYPAFQEAQILWECDFPETPGELESLLKERIGMKQSIDLLKAREEQINTQLLSFYQNNRIPGVRYEGYTVAIKNGAQVTLNKEAMMLEGVKEEVIDRCTNRTPWVTVECRESKAKHH